LFGCFHLKLLLAKDGALDFVRPIFVSFKLFAHYRADAVGDAGGVELVVSVEVLGVADDGEFVV